MTNEIRYLGDLQRLERKPGDRFVLTVDTITTSDMQARIQQWWRGHWEPGEAAPPLMILDRACKLGVISAAIMADVHTNLDALDSQNTATAKALGAAPS